MTEKIEVQVSEFIDDEMSVEECHFFVRRLQSNGDARASFLRYQLIGAALRGEHLRPDGAERPEQPEQPEHVREVVPPLLVAAGIAACLVLVAVFGLGSGSLAGIFSHDEELIGSAPNNDVTDVQYLMLHMGYSSTLNRSLMHSNVFSESESGIDSDIPDDLID